MKYLYDNTKPESFAVIYRRMGIRLVANNGESKINWKMYGY